MLLLVGLSAALASCALGQPGELDTSAFRGQLSMLVKGENMNQNNVAKVVDGIRAQLGSDEARAIFDENKGRLDELVRSGGGARANVQKMDPARLKEHLQGMVKKARPAAADRLSKCGKASVDLPSVAGNAKMTFSRWIPRKCITDDAGTKSCQPLTAAQIGATADQLLSKAPLQISGAGDQLADGDTLEIVAEMKNTASNALTETMPAQMTVTKEKLARGKVKASQKLQSVNPNKALKLATETDVDACGGEARTASSVKYELLGDDGKVKRTLSESREMTLEAGTLLPCSKARIRVTTSAKDSAPSVEEKEISTRCGFLDSIRNEERLKSFKAGADEVFELDLAELGDLTSGISGTAVEWTCEAVLEGQVVPRECKTKSGAAFLAAADKAALKLDKEAKDLPAGSYRLCATETSTEGEDLGAKCFDYLLSSLDLPDIDVEAPKRRLSTARDEDMEVEVEHCKPLRSFQLSFLAGESGSDFPCGQVQRTATSSRFQGRSKQKDGTAESVAAPTASLNSAELNNWVVDSSTVADPDKAGCSKTTKMVRVKAGKLPAGKKLRMGVCSQMEGGGTGRSIVDLETEERFSGRGMAVSVDKARCDPSALERVETRLAGELPEGATVQFGIVEKIKSSGAVKMIQSLSEPLREASASVACPPADALLGARVCLESGSCEAFSAGAQTKVTDMAGKSKAAVRSAFASAKTAADQMGLGQQERIRSMKAFATKAADPNTRAQAKEGMMAQAKVMAGQTEADLDSSLSSIRTLASDVLGDPALAASDGAKDIARGVMEKMKRAKKLAKKSGRRLSEDFEGVDFSAVLEKTGYEGRRMLEELKAKRSAVDWEGVAMGASKSMSEFSGRAKGTLKKKLSWTDGEEVAAHSGPKAPVLRVPASINAMCGQSAGCGVEMSQYEPDIVFADSPPKNLASKIVDVRIVKGSDPSADVGLNGGKSEIVFHKDSLEPLKEGQIRRAYFYDETRETGSVAGVETRTEADGSVVAVTTHHTSFYVQNDAEGSSPSSERSGAVKQTAVGFATMCGLAAILVFIH